MSELSLTRVNVMMGNSCNFRCRHCIQTGAMETPDTRTADSCVIDYIRHLARIRPRDRRINVAFWGGEPLLYLRTIKDIVRRVGDSVDYSIVTNGSMLFERDIPYFNEHHITIILSNDGAKTAAVRGINMLEYQPFVDIYKQVKYKGIEDVVTPYNQDYDALWKYIEGKLGRDIPIYSGHLVCSWDMPNDLYQFDYDAYARTIHDMAHRAYEKLLRGEIGREYLLIEQHVNQIAAYMDTGKSSSCSQMKDMISLDLQGNVYACHNGHARIGSVTDSYETLKQYFDAYIDGLPLDDCKACRYQPVCGRKCFHAFDSAGKRACCTMEKIFIDGCCEFLKLVKNGFEPVDVEDSYDCNSKTIV